MTPTSTPPMDPITATRCRRRLFAIALAATAVVSSLGVAVVGQVGAEPAAPAAPTAATPVAGEAAPLLDLRRPVYFTGEPIAVRARGWNAADPAAGELAVQLLGEDGSRVRALFQPISRPLSPTEKPDADGPTVQGWLLRPGRYSIEVAAGTRKTQADFQLYSGIRRSSFQVIDAGFDGSVSPLAPRGENGLGFNVVHPVSDRPGVSRAWATATDKLITGVAPGEGVADGLWLPPITDPLRRGKAVADGSSDGSAGGWLYPAFACELGRARDRDRPQVCLPTASPRDADAWLVERNLAFVSGGRAVAAGPVTELMVVSPDSVQPGSVRASSGPASAPLSPRLLETVIAANKLAGRLGTIFTTMPATRPPVALLVPQQPADADDRRAFLAWIAGQMAHQPLAIVTPADVLDGSVSRHHRVVVVATGGLIDARTSGILARYVAAGGVVLNPDDAVTDIAGATKLGMAIDTSQFAAIDRLAAEDKPLDAARLRRPTEFFRIAEPLAGALRAKFDAVGVRPAMTADSPTVFTAHHGYGEVDYHFVVNATPDDAAGVAALSLRPTEVSLRLPATGGPIYDAIGAGLATGFTPDGVHLATSLRLGAGQMRVYARTARPITGVQVSPPQVVTDYKAGGPPIRLELAAAVVADDGRTLNGSIPLRVRITDGLGVVRYDLWRATERGVLRLDLPLAANDPAGRWTVAVTELLAGSTGEAPFDYRPPTQVGAIAELSTGFDESRQPTRERPSATSVTAAGKATRPAEPTIAWRTSVPDRVVSILVDQQKLTVFSNDGTGTQIDGKGGVLAQSPAPVIASPRPPEALPPAVAGNVLKDRAIKRSVTEGGLTAVGYWGSMVQIFGPDGAARAQQVLPSGVADLVWFDGKLIVGLSDGTVLALRVGG